MELIINHQRKKYDTLPSSLQELVHSEIPPNSKGIAVALNNLVIPKQQWNTVLLQHNDHVLIITATQGG